MPTTPRKEDHESVEQYLAAWDLELAIRRDDRLTAAELTAACRALAEAQRLPWREGWGRVD